MAVSLVDAWNDVINPHEEMERSERPRVSAKSAMTESDAMHSEPSATSEATHLAYYDAFVSELKALRVEESRRCVVYMCMGALLFAVLCIYVERMHKDIKILTRLIITHRSSAGISGNPPYSGNNDIRNLMHPQWLT